MKSRYILLISSCFAIFVISILVFNVAAVDTTTTTKLYEAEQLELNDISFLPALPNTYYNRLDYPKIMLNKNKETGNYRLYLMNDSVRHIGYWNYLIQSEHSNNLVYEFDPNITPYKWVQIPNVREIQERDYVFIYRNFDILTDGYNTVWLPKNGDSWVLTTFALGGLQNLIKNNLTNIIPIGIAAMTAFILLRIITKYFKPKDPYKKNKFKIKKKMKGWK